MYRKIIEKLIEELIEEFDFIIEDADERKFFIEKTSTIFKNKIGTPLLPEKNDSLGISILKPKTTALSFDKVYKHPLIISEMPDEIGFYGATIPEIGFFSGPLFALALHNTGIQNVYSDIFSGNNKESIKNESNEKQSWDFISRDFLKAFNKMPTIIYNKSEYESSDLKNGKENVLSCIIQNLELVDEAKLDWKQVMDFRKDDEARLKYKRLMNWIDNRIQSKSINQIQDEIEIKLADYKWSLNKHGIKTTYGAINALFDPKFLGSISAIAASSAFIGGEVWSTLATTGVIVGKTALTLGLNQANFISDKRPDNYEIAYIYDIEKKIK